LVALALFGSRRVRPAAWSVWPASIHTSVKRPSRSQSNLNVRKSC